MSIQAHHQKNFADHFCLPPQPNGAKQNQNWCPTPLLDRANVLHSLFCSYFVVKNAIFPPPPKKNNSWLASLAKFNISCFLNFTVLKWCFHRSTWVILKIMRVVAYLVNHDTYRIETLHVFGTGLFTHSIQK